ncbi:MAG: hypothetical protein AAFX85_17275 [Pseudomonadota bacterium]
MRHLEAFRRHGLFVDRSLSQARKGRPDAQGRELPVKSWEDYKDWCQQVRDNWEEDAEQVARPRRASRFAEWGR